MGKNRQHIVRLTTHEPDGTVYDTSFTTQEEEFENGAMFGSLGYCVSTAIMMMECGSAQSLLYILADAVEFLGDYDPFEYLTPESDQDEQEREAAWKMINAAKDFVALRTARRRAMNEERAARKE